ncbi:hypothetical protein HCG51_01980 [Tolypothrix sp. PCC 7910]|uniref:hypothetical protein n=1 Tax=Tolypothrix sp. PCC 7910 TaxID=2099387 RepID=UPI0014277BFE|nr:hypothetical protein [Tolypothrix sp. PCC 7910]QIR35640.1 hypothetical protein HCG51_01980 [Tolypothrix sp. PCC 7910]
MGKGKEKTFNRSADAHGEALNLEPFPKTNFEFKTPNRVILTALVAISRLLYLEKK